MAYRRTEKTEARRAAQQDALLKSAIKVITVMGFQGLTISAVADMAGVATGTVYKYFPSRAVLCAEAFKLATEREVLKVQEAAFPEQNLCCRERLSNAITIFANRAIKADRLAYALIAEPADSSVDAERLKYRQAYADIYEKLIEEGIASGEFSPQNAAVSAAALVGVIAESLVAPLGRGGIKAENRKYLIEAINRFCLRAITGRADQALS